MTDGNEGWESRTYRWISSKNITVISRRKALVSKKFALGAKYASFEAVSEVPDTQRKPRFANFRALFFCPKPPQDCSVLPHFGLRKLSFDLAKGIL
jgi:hypothetical protein